MKKKTALTLFGEDSPNIAKFYVIFSKDVSSRSLPFKVRVRVRFHVQWKQPNSILIFSESLLNTASCISWPDLCCWHSQRRYCCLPFSVVCADLICSHSSREAWVIMHCWSGKLITLASKYLVINYFANIYIELHKQKKQHLPFCPTRIP